jgi:hypothetical protein
MGPMMTPTLKVMGNSRKALDWYLRFKPGEQRSNKRSGYGGNCCVLLFPHCLANPADLVNKK